MSRAEVILERIAWGLFGIACGIFVAAVIWAH